MKHFDRTFYLVLSFCANLCSNPCLYLFLHYKDWLNPVCFYNVSKGKEKCGADGSFYNQEEVTNLYN